MNIKYFIKHWPFTLVMALLLISFIGWVVHEAGFPKEASTRIEYSKPEREAGVRHYNIALNSSRYIRDVYADFQEIRSEARSGNVYTSERLFELYDSYDDFNKHTHEAAPSLESDNANTAIVSEMEDSDEHYALAVDTMVMYMDEERKCILRNDNQACYVATVLYEEADGYFQKAQDKADKTVKRLEKFWKGS